MKIYEIGTGYTPIPATMGAATEIVVEELTKAFQKLEVPVEILDIKASNRKANSLPITEVWVPKCFSGTDVKLGLMHKLKRVVYSVCLAQKLKKILKNSHEKVVLHFHNQYNMFFFLKLVPEKLRKKALTAYTNHSGIWRMPWDEIEGIINKRYFQEAECMKMADLVFVLNNETMHNASVHLNIPKDHFIRINNGVNTDIYHPLTAVEKEKAKAHFGLTDKKVILQVGSVCENKGQLRSLALLTHTLQTSPNIAFVYAGGIVSEDYQRHIQETALKLGIEKQVIYLGMVKPGEELNQLYNTAEATILASEYEGFPLVTIESLAAGIPAMICEGGPIPFLKGCMQYRKESFDSIIMQQVLFDRTTYHMLCNEARINTLLQFSWDSVAKEYKHHF